MHSTCDVMLRVKSLEDAKAYYHGVLGFDLAADSERVVGFKTGGITVYFERGEDNGAVFEFEVDDISKTKARLLTLGCVLLEEDAAIPRCYLRDRFGLTFNLTQTYH